MKVKELFNRVTNSKEDIIQKFINILDREKISYAVIGGFGVNAYCSPVLTTDFDVVVEKNKIYLLKEELKKHGFKIKTHPHTIEISSHNSDVKIQIQKEDKFQSFLSNAKKMGVVGYNLIVASKEDIINSKIYAFLDKTRSSEKRAKDISDIIRLIKTDYSLITLLPESIKKKIEEFE